MRVFISIWTILIFILAIRLWNFYSSPSPYRIGQHVVLETTLLTEPVKKGGYQTFIVFAKGHFGVLIKMSAPETLRYGEHIRLDGILMSSTLGGKEVVSLQNPKITHLTSNLLFSRLGWFREKSKKIYSEVLSPDQAGLLLGIVYGIKAPLSYRFASAIQSVGLTHVSAASGMNVTLLTGFLGTLLIFFMKRQKTVGVIAGVLTIYMILSGMQGSILRATLMGGGAIVAGIFGRQRQSYYLLFVTAYVLLFISPLLLQDLGFQLSFLSTFGILLFNPLIENIVAGKVFLEDLSTSWCAQILSLPLILITFGKYNLISLIVNMLVLWVVAPLMILGGVASLVGIVMPALSYWILVMCIPLLWYFQTVTLFFAKYHTGVTVSSIAPAFMISYYCLIGVMYLFWKNRVKYQAEK